MSTRFSQSLSFVHNGLLPDAPHDQWSVVVSLSSTKPATTVWAQRRCCFRGRCFCVLVGRATSRGGIAWLNFRFHPRQTQSEIPSTTTPDRNSWAATRRGMDRFVDELHLRDPGHNPTSNALLLERSIAKESELFCCRVGAIPHRGNSCDAV